MSGEKCAICGCRKFTPNPVRGEVTCDDCGYVKEENQIDFNDMNHTHGEHSHCAPTHGRHIGRNRRNRTYIDRRDVKNRRDRGLWRGMYRANEKTNLRANEIVREMEWRFEGVYVDAALEALHICFTDEVDKGAVKLKRPYHQMRDMKSKDGKDDVYVVSVSAVSTLMALSDFCLVPYFIWKGVADSLGLERNDCIKHKRHIKRFLQAMYLAHDNIVTRYAAVPLLRLRAQALDSLFQSLRKSLEHLKVERREELLKEVNERLQKLGEPSLLGDLGDERPDTLTAVVTLVVAEDLGIGISKEVVAMIFHFSTGGMNAPMRRCAHIVRARA